MVVYSQELLRLGHRRFGHVWTTFVNWAVKQKERHVSLQGREVFDVKINRQKNQYYFDNVLFQDL